MPHSSLLANTTTENLVLGEQLLLWSLRRWAEAVTQEGCPHCAIVEPFALIKAEAVAEALHQSLLLLMKPGMAVTRLHRPSVAVIAEDESRFLLAAGAAYHGDPDLAARLLSGGAGSEAATALGKALQALGVLLARHGLSLPQRLPPVVRLARPVNSAPLSAWAAVDANAGMALVH
ncbi:MAG: hypothetical protein AAFY02_19065 [Pseudomonadota bacterium]